ncbi:MAG: hypothetical protein JWP58_2688 [Hymenobacter sp.]|nr:hypothetical protein [Hymenobacter sp.]
MTPPKNISQLTAEIDTAVNVTGPAPHKTTASGLNTLLKSLAAELTTPAPVSPLPLATTSAAGAVKVGANLTVAPDGTVAAAAQVQNGLAPDTATAAPSVAAVNTALTGLTTTLASLSTALTTEKTRMDTLVAGAPAALDTLAEISSQLAADAQGAAALLATQNQHTQQLATLKPLVAGTNVSFNTSTTPGSIIISATVPPDVLSAVARRYRNGGGGWITHTSYYEAIASLGDTELAVLNRLQYTAGITTATMCYGSVEAAGFPIVVNAVFSFGCYNGYIRNASFSGSGSLVATSSGVPNGCIYVLANVRSSLKLTVNAFATLYLDNYVATAPHTITYAGTLVIHANCDLTGVTLVKSGNGVLDDRRDVLVAPNGSRYRLLVDNSGVLSTVAL